MPPIERSNQSKLLWLLIAFTSMCFLLMANQHAINIPFRDDYNRILDFINQFTICEGLWCKIKLICSERNEHRAPFSELIIAAYYYLFKEINIPNLMQISNAFWIATYLSLCFIANKTKASNWTIVYISLIFLIVNVDINMRVAAGLIYVPSVLFSIWAIYYSAYKPKNILAIVAFCSLASSAFSIGILAFPVCIFLLFPKYKKQSIYVGLGLVILLIAYLSGHEPTGQKLEIPINGFNDIVTIATNFVAYFGAPFYHICSAPIFLGLSGLSILLLSIYVFFKLYKKETHSNKFILGILLFGISGAFVVALFRSDLGLGSTISNRYRLFQAIPMLALVLSFPIVFQKKWTFIKWPVLIYLISLNVSSNIVQYNWMSAHKSFVTASWKDYLTNKKVTGLPFSEPDKLEDILDLALDNYYFPKIQEDELIPVQIAIDLSKEQKADFQIANFKINKSKYFIQISGKSKSSLIPQYNRLIIENNKQTFEIPIYFAKDPRFFKKGLKLIYHAIGNTNGNLISVTSRMTLLNNRTGDYVKLN